MPPRLFVILAAMAKVNYLDPERAQRNFELTAARVPMSVAQLLPTVLADSPDPDSALNLFERLTVEVSPELIQLLQKHSFLVHYAATVFGYSPYLGDALLQNLDLFYIFAREHDLGRSQSREDFAERFARFRSRSLETDVAALLARFKKREYIRIMLRDALGVAVLAEITGEISSLSDIVIEEALQECSAGMHGRYGAPQIAESSGRVADARFTVISLGKLGGHELNYNSDVDLMFLYSDGEAPSAAQLPMREYFVRLAQQLTELLSRPTKEGPVFRIDLRLRPQGNEGEVAIPLNRALRYYDDSAHDWELQALIKARHSAGDQRLARDFVRGVQARVYRKGLNFSAIKTALSSREKIGARRRRAALEPSAKQIDVKLDPGGIRDIEFLVQCLQRVYGGEEPWLRSGGTLFSLQKLHDKDHISGKDFHQISETYEFLRHLEHRLQLRGGQQTHRLPSSADELAIIARSMTRAAKQWTGTAQELPVMVTERMAVVAEIYRRLIHAQQAIQAEETVRLFTLVPPRGLESGREDSYEQILHRLSTDSPAFYEVAARRDVSARTRRNLHRFLSSALTSSERYAAVLRAAQGLDAALVVFDTSDYLSDVLIRHPEELAAIGDLAAPQAPGSEPLPFEAVSRTGTSVAAAPAPAVSYADALARLRQDFRHKIFLNGIADLLSHRSVFTSLAAETAAADSAVQAAFAIASADPQLKPAEGAGFAIFALGRLGTYEFDLGSDGDLLFVRGENFDREAARRIAEQIVDILAAYTQQGSVFPVDTRLRPMGAEGELVTTTAALSTYFSNDAQPWEALSFTKLRMLSGTSDLEAAVTTAVEEGCRRFLEAADFASHTRAMRTRLEERDAGKGIHNFKTRAGGFYDIDFITSYLFIKHRVLEPGANVRDRLHVLAARRVLHDADCAALDYAAELFRTTDHLIRLVSGRSQKSLPANEHDRENISRLVARFMDQEFAHGLEPELDRLRQEVRSIFDRLVV